MTCLERQDQIVLFAAGELDRAEAATLQAHLAIGCPTCAGYLAEIQAVINLLPESLNEMQPSAEAARRLMVELPPQESAPALTPVASTRAQSYWARWRPLALAACVALVASLAFSAYRTHELEDQKNREVAAANSELKTAQTELAQTKVNLQTIVQAHAQELANAQAQLAGLKKQLDTETRGHTQLVALLQQKNISVALLAGKEQPDAKAIVVLDRANRKAQMIATDLHSLQPDRSYELWLVPKAGKPIAAGVFTPQEDGTATVLVTIPADAGELAAAAVTNEPAGGGPTPTAKDYVVIGTIVAQ